MSKSTSLTKSHAIVPAKLVQPLCYFIFLALCYSTNILAESEIHWQAGFGVTLGGDTLETAVFEDNSTVNIDAGDLIHILGSTVFVVPDSHYQVHVNAGYHFDFARDNDGDAIIFSRYPLELGLFFAKGTFRVGTGLSYHIHPQLNLKDIKLENVNFKNSLGYYLQGGGFIARRIWIDVRYLVIDYISKSNETSFDKADGSHFGIYASLPF